MAISEVNGLQRYKDADGNVHILYPVTKAELVDGLDELMDEHTGDKNNPHGVTAAQVGAITPGQVGDLHVWQQTQPSGEVDYLTATDKDAYEEYSGDEAYYTLGEKVTGSFRVSCIDEFGRVLSVSDSIAVSPDGTVALNSPKKETIGVGSPWLEDVASFKAAFNGKFVLQATYSSNFTGPSENMIFYIPSDAVWRTEDTEWETDDGYVIQDVYINCYQPVVGHAATASIKYLGLLGSGAAAAPANHEHSANDIASGVLPIARGGTGAATAAAALAALGAQAANNNLVQFVNNALQTVAGGEVKLSDAKIALGSYVGTGYAYAEMNVPFSPELVIISGSNVYELSSSYSREDVGIAIVAPIGGASFTSEYYSGNSTKKSNLVFTPLYWNLNGSTLKIECLRCSPLYICNGSSPSTVSESSIDYASSMNVEGRTYTFLCIGEG